MKLDKNIGLGHTVSDGDPVPPKKGSAPIFGTCLLWQNGWMYQDATWYGGRPQPRRYCVRWGPAPTPPKMGHSSPHFSVHVLCQDGWMDQDATWYGGRPRLMPHCVRWGPSSHSNRDTAPYFRPMSLVTKRSLISDTAEHLFLIDIIVLSVYAYILFSVHMGHVA